MNCLRPSLLGRLFLLCVALAYGLKAQEMAGVWAQTNSASENGTEMTVSDTLKLSADGVFRNASVMEMSMDDGSGQKATVKMLVSCSGKWSCEGGVLTQTYDAKSIRSEVLTLTSDTLKLKNIGVKNPETDTYTRVE